MAPESTTGGRIRSNLRTINAHPWRKPRSAKTNRRSGGLLSADRDLAARPAHGHERAGRTHVLDGPEARVLHGAVGDGDVGDGGSVQEGHRDPSEQREIGRAHV